MLFDIAAAEAVPRDPEEADGVDQQDDDGEAEGHGAVDSAAQAPCQAHSPHR